MTGTCPFPRDILDKSAPEVHSSAFGLEKELELSTCGRRNLKRFVLPIVLGLEGELEKVHFPVARLETELEKVRSPVSGEGA